MDVDFVELKQVGFRIAEPAYDFLIGADAEAGWKARGLTGYDQDEALKQQLAKQRAEAIHALQTTDVGKNTLAAFESEVRDVMRAILLGNYTWLDSYLGDRHFVLVCGLHRSGGTYLLDELSEIYSYPYQKYHCMHDDIPEFFSALYWKVPHFYLQYICEVAQFLVMVRRNVPWKVVIKKRAIWTFAVESLAHIFRQRLTIYLHVRHPISWAWGDSQLRDGKGADISVVPSMQQYLQQYDRPLRGNETPCQIMMRFWRIFHMESARKGVDYTVLPFGNYGNYLVDLAGKIKPSYTPAEFKPTARDHSKYAAHFEEANEIVAEVREHWARLGLKFPALELL